MSKFLQTFSNLFWLWTILGAIGAWFVPEVFTWFITGKFPGTSLSLVHIGLGVIMLGMGLTLSIQDFKAVCKTPKLVAIGILAQFVIMPLLGWGVASLLDISDDLKLGIILVSCCPGGTASNVICYLARANVALSVLMTMCSTLIAVAATPYLTKIYASQILEVDAGKMVVSMITIVVLPILLGIILSHVFKKKLDLVRQISPAISVIVIVLIVGGIIGLNTSSIADHASSLLPAIFILHALGFGIAYGIAKLFKFDEKSCRTLSIEVGMQNSGLGAQLARAHFSPIAATPCAISAFYHCIIGAVLAGFWRRKRK